VDARGLLERRLLASTVALTSGGRVGTGFFVAPDLVLTCAHVVGADGGRPRPILIEAGRDRAAERLTVVEGTWLTGESGGPDLVLLRAERDDHPYVLFSEVVEPGDELWGFGYPEGSYRTGEPVGFRYEGLSERADGARLLRVAHGQVRRGFSGSPVLNWRTGGICGLVRFRDMVYDSVVRLVPVSEIMAVYPQLATQRIDHNAWFEVLDDAQLKAGGWRAPGPRLRRYLEAAQRADRMHPYFHLLGEGVPPLTNVYLRQQASPQLTADNRVDAGELAVRHEGVQVIGGPGSGKSSLLRHITAMTAGSWLRCATGTFVPILVPAASLTRPMSMSEALAGGVHHELHTELDNRQLIEMFQQEPMPGVPWLVLVDGLDEVLDQQQRRWVLDVIERYREHPLYRFMVTSRQLGEHVFDKIYDPQRYPTYVIEPFDDEGLREFAARWFAALLAPAPAEVAARFMRRLEHNRLHGMAHIPLIATMMCVLFMEDPERDLPINRCQLYGSFIAWLSSKQRRSAEVRAKLCALASAGGAVAETAAGELLDRLPEVLRAIALQRQGIGALMPHVPAPIAEQVARWNNRWPPGTLGRAGWQQVVSEALRVNGLLVQRGNDFRFLHQTIEEYLAAAHLIEGSRRSIRKLLAPQRGAWPWSSLEVKVFVAALLADNETDISRILLRLLRRRHRLPNIFFVVELLRQGVSVAPRVRQRTMELLVELLDDLRVSRHDWRNIAASLIELDQDQALMVLSRVVDDSGAAHRDRLEAAQLLGRIDQRLAAAALDSLVTDSRTSGHDRFRAAQALSSVNQERAAAVFQRLAAVRDLKELRIEAALAVAAVHPPRGLTLLADIARDLEADGHLRLTAARALTARDAEHGMPLLVMLARSPQMTERLRVEAAHALAKLDTHMALPLYLSLANELQNGCLEAITSAGKIDLPSAISAAKIVVANREATVENRLGAASWIAEHDAQNGLKLLLELTADRAMGGQRVTAGIHAGKFDPAAAAKALADLSGASIKEPDRLAAATAILNLDFELGIEALSGLVAANVRPSTRLAAAHAVAARDRNKGAQLFLDLTKQGADDETRLEAGERLLKLNESNGRAALQRIAYDRSVRTDRRMHASQLAGIKPPADLVKPPKPKPEHK
jgi:Trypsin-like peptidase domain/NACHT domain